MALNDFTNVAAVTALVVALVQVLKPALPERLLPLGVLAIGVGVSLLGYGARILAPDLGNAILIGLVAALSAMGVWSGAKHSIGG